MTTHLKPYVRACKQVHANWKDYKSLDNTAKYNTAKTLWRSAQGHQAARKKEEEHQWIMDAEGINKQEFDKLNGWKVNNIWKL